ncbi:MAG: shikimate dehydrogenase [Acidobacteriaceae bacterium]|nr:shikimate dehydrogenase [Acidobacteriaceae bacterium]
MALGLPTAAQLRQAAEREYKDGNSFFEFRLDHLRDPASALPVIRNLRDSSPEVYILATCRHRLAHGGFSGPLSQQIALLNAAAEHGAQLIDIEIESLEQKVIVPPSIRESAALIVSYHNFRNTPALDPVLQRMRRFPADGYKLATTACKPSDNLRLVHLLRERQDIPLIALAMSETGVVSRVLGPSLGSVFTYVAPGDHTGTAPGQVPGKLFRSLYRPEKLGRQSKVYGVIASPVAHSKSPLIHNRAFHARRVDAVYLPFLVQAQQLSDWMKLASSLPVSGFSVTIPHKQRILRHLDVVEPLARRIGAVNTVWRKGGKWRGTNTDADGVLKPLCKHLRPANSSVLIVGYGGAARAAAFALSDARAHVTITGRNATTAQSLARAVKGEAVTLADSQRRHYDALLHATPVGMFPDVKQCIFDDRIPADIVLDMVYNPHETALLKEAKRQGCKVISGTEMLLEQAASQFEIWTGESAPRVVMQAALGQHGE